MQGTKESEAGLCYFIRLSSLWQSAGVTGAHVWHASAPAAGEPLFWGQLSERRVEDQGLGEWQGEDLVCALVVALRHIITMSL